MSYLDSSATLLGFLELWYDKGSDIYAAKQATVGSFVNCVNNDVFNACWSLDVNFQGRCLPADGTNYIGFLNVGCILICLFVAVCPMGAVLLKGEVDICRGSYMACKWEFERSRFYHCAAYLLLAYTATTFALAFYVTSASLSSELLGGLAEAFLCYQLAPVVLLISSAVALTRAQDPRFDYRSEQFGAFRFRRSWKEILRESNSAFGARLEKAVLLAMAGQRTELAGMLQDAAQIEDVVRACSTGRSLEDSTDCESGSDASSEYLLKD